MTEEKSLSKIDENCIWHAVEVFYNNINAAQFNAAQFNAAQ